MKHVAREMLVALGDDGGRAALDWAVDRALTSGCDLRLVHVVHPPEGLAGPENLLLDFDAARLAGREIVLSAAARVADAVAGRVSVSIDSPTGQVVEELTELADHCVAVVVQHRRRSRLGQVLGGSVAAGLAGRARVPVVSVPDDWAPRDRPAGLPSRITVGVADVDGGAALVAHAVEGAARSGAAVTLLHAWDVPAAYELAPLRPDHLVQADERATRAMEDLASPWRQKYPDSDIELRVTRGRPAEMLFDASQDSDLVVLGRARGHVPLRRLGSVARALLRESACPVEIVPEGPGDPGGAG